MGRFLNSQKKAQAGWRSCSKWLTPRARAGVGYYSKRPRKQYDFCLPLECAPENLFPDIADKAIRYFRSPPGIFGGNRSISWHDGRNHLPSTHLCDSQVCCVNFLFALMDSEAGASDLLSQVFDDCDRAIPALRHERAIAPTASG